METLNDFFATLGDTPLPTLLILAGLFFLLLSIVAKVGALLVVSPARQRQATVLGLLLLIGGLGLHWLEEPPAPVIRGDETQVLTRDYLVGHTWTFSHEEGDVISPQVRLDASGAIEGIDHPNETRWGLEDGILLFFHANGKPSTRFNEVLWDDGRAVLKGRLLISPPEDVVVHVLSTNE
jgi:hypothetical protein